MSAQPLFDEQRGAHVPPLQVWHECAHGVVSQQNFGEEKPSHVCPMTHCAVPVHTPPGVAHLPSNVHSSLAPLHDCEPVVKHASFGRSLLAAMASGWQYGAPGGLQPTSHVPHTPADWHAFSTGTVVLCTGQNWYESARVHRSDAPDKRVGKHMPAALPAYF